MNIPTWLEKRFTDYWKMYFAHHDLIWSLVSACIPSPIESFFGGSFLKKNPSILEGAMYIYIYIYIYNIYSNLYYIYIYILHIMYILYIIYIYMSKKPTLMYVTTVIIKKHIYFSIRIYFRTVFLRQCMCVWKIHVSLTHTHIIYM